MGAPAPLPTVVTQTSFEYTSTRSTFIMDVSGLVGMNITFLSPLTPTDMTRQSLPFSYVDVIVSSSDGATHNVQVYTDITAGNIHSFMHLNNFGSYLTASVEWVSADRTAIAQWDFGVKSETSTTTSKRSLEPRQSVSNSTASTKSTNVDGTSGGIAYHRFYRQTQLLWSETLDQTDYGYWYWATDNVANLTFQSGIDDDVRDAFTTNGVLANTNDTNYRAINDTYPTFAFAVDLGSIDATAVSTLFTLGLTQESAIQFDGASGNVSVPSLWTSYYATELDAVSNHKKIGKALLNG